MTFELPFSYGFGTDRLSIWITAGLTTFLFLFYVAPPLLAARLNNGPISEQAINRGLIFSTCIGLCVIMPKLPSGMGGAMAMSIYFATESGRWNPKGILNKPYILFLFLGSIFFALLSKVHDEHVTIGTIVVGWIAPMIGVILGQIVGLFLYRCVPPLIAAWHEIKAIGRSLGGYSLGYIAITILFAGLYATLFRWDPISLKGVPSGFHFIDYWFLSLTVLTTLGSEVVPANPVAKAIVGAEVLLGIGWTVIVFAAVLSAAQKSQLGKARADKTPEDVEITQKRESLES